MSRRRAASVSVRSTRFAEVMAGAFRLAGEGRERPMRLELSADLPGVLRRWGDTEGGLTGRVHVPGWADDHAATGRLRVAPLAARRIRYTMDFTAEDGRRLRLDGWKSVAPRHPVRSMTSLPVTVTDADGAVVGDALLRFDLRDVARLAGGVRFPGPGPMRSRWRGQAGRLEVWYTTLTDPATGTGVWLHHELVAPDEGEARAHGWAAVFPPGETPAFARFGPHGWERPKDAVFAAGPVAQTDDTLTGTAGDIAWDLRETGGGRPVHTFPRWAWETELLPAALGVAARRPRRRRRVRNRGGGLGPSGAGQAAAAPVRPAAGGRRRSARRVPAVRGAPSPGPHRAADLDGPRPHRRPAHPRPGDAASRGDRRRRLRRP